MSEVLSDDRSGSSSFSMVMSHFQRISGALSVSQRFSDSLEGSRKFSNVLSGSLGCRKVLYCSFTLSAVFFLNFRLKHDSQRLFLLGVGRQDGRNTDPSSSGKNTKLFHDN